MQRTKLLIIISAAIISILFIFRLFIQPEPQLCENWVLWRNTKDYKTGFDHNTLYSGKPAPYLEARSSYPKSMTIISSSFKADNYLNKRISFSADIKSRNLGYGGLMLRIYTPDELLIAFAKASYNSDWKRYELIVDIPVHSKAISLGIMNDGKGKIWFENFTMEEVPEKTKLNRLSTMKINFEKEDAEKLADYPELDICQHY